MPESALTAVVVGAGWAGEGHTLSLQHNDVEVVAICARKPEVVQEVAAKLNVPQASTDWRESLMTLKPDIVALASPAVLRREVVDLAAELGCHILCDKPLALTEAEAKHLYQTVKQADVKHAYAATQKYDPSIFYLTDLIANKAIGTLHEIQLLFSVPYNNPLTPWGWYDRLASGGGLLANGLPHNLGILEEIVQGKVVSLAGTANNTRTQAPYVPNIHDIRQRLSTQLSEEEAAGLEWRDCDADTAFTALFHLESALSDSTIPVFMQVNAVAPYVSKTNGWHFYGDEGSIFGAGFFALELTQQTASETKNLPTPQKYLDKLPQVGDDELNKWVALANDFVAHVRGEPHEPYLTFEDGWRYQAAIDAIRQGRGFYQIS